MTKIIVGVIALILVVGLFLVLRPDNDVVVVKVPTTATSTRVSTSTPVVAATTSNEVAVVVGQINRLISVVKI
jgi:hypothetical protein